MNTFVFRDDEFENLVDGLFARTDVESAAYLRCGVSQTGDVARLLVREVIHVREDDYLRREPDGLSIASRSYVPVIKRSRTEREAFVLVHNHPHGPRAFSEQDDDEERPFFQKIHERVPGLAHASIVFTSPTSFAARHWREDGTEEPIERIFVIGRRFRLLSNVSASPLPTAFDRHVRAFGDEIQRLLQQLTIGIVGGGGTGSPVFEQALRLGVGKIIPIDADDFTDTNANRVLNSRLSDEGTPKVDLLRRTARLSGLPTIVDPVHGDVTREEGTRRLRECDVIFCCTDGEYSRAILSRFATYYLIPVFDMGVLIDRNDVTGRVTLLMPGTACLWCRGRLSVDRVRAEAMSRAEYERQRHDGYVPELGIPNPAVISFTMGTAVFAFSDFLHRLTGFMGERTSTETLIEFELPQIRSNSTPPDPRCNCANRMLWGRGDVTPFIGLTWRTEEEEDVVVPRRANA